MTTRQITTHHGTGNMNDRLVIHALNEAGRGGAHNEYSISTEGKHLATLYFQYGDPNNGINGITNESLLAIVRDRLACFQQGPFSCRENDEALGHVTAAMNALHERTRHRIGRGVEGKMEK